MGDVGNNGAYARLRAQATSMRRKAESVGNKLQAIAEGIAKKYGARVTPINYKSVDSIVRKAKGEANGIKDIKDSYRTTIIADKGSIPKIIKDLQGRYKGFEFVRLKEQKLDTGYSGNIINIRNKKTGLIGEIQVNTAKMIYAKENYSIAYKRWVGRPCEKSTKRPRNHPVGDMHYTSKVEPPRVTEVRSKGRYLCNKLTMLRFNN